MLNLKKFEKPVDETEITEQKEKKKVDIRKVFIGICCVGIGILLIIILCLLFSDGGISTQQSSSNGIKETIASTEVLKKCNLPEDVALLEGRTLQMKYGKSSKKIGETMTVGDLITLLGAKVNGEDTKVEVDEFISVRATLDGEETISIVAENKKGAAADMKDCQIQSFTVTGSAESKGSFSINGITAHSSVDDIKLKLGTASITATNTDGYTSLGYIYRLGDNAACLLTSDSAKYRSIMINYNNTPIQQTSKSFELTLN